MHTVLLVDDESYTRIGLRNLIDWEACGFQVIGEAEDGEDAIAFILEQKPDLVITDIRMPMMDGLELIRRSRETMPASPDFIIISGYDEFSYAQQAVRYGVLDFVLKPIDEEVLTSALQKLEQVMTRNKRYQAQQELDFSRQLVPLMMTGEADDASIFRWCAQTGIELPDRFRYILVELNDIHPWQDRAAAPDKDRTVSLVQREIAAWVPAAPHCYIHEHFKRLGFILPERNLEPLEGGLERFALLLQSGLTTKLDTPVYVYVGEQVETLNELGQSYRSASYNLMYKFINKGGVFIHDRLKGQPLNYANLENAMSKELTDQVEENDLPAITASVDDIFAEFSMRHYTPEAVKLAIHYCVSALVNIMKQMGIEESNVSSLEPMLGWQDLCITPEELKRLFTAFTLESAQWMAKHRKDGLKGAIQKIKVYIEDNYQDNINLKQIAAKFYMNPVYLGQLFKKTYGIYFNDFLCQIRVEQSQRLLRQTDLRIYEIAERAGFSNADYFVTKFEKLLGMTPTEYRNKLI